GIAGWRNILEGRTISGAVTEINAECVGALRATSRFARLVGRPPTEVAEFHAAAERLTQAINEHLLNPENGLYYLNIDAQGQYHSDVTADELYPVMFGVAPDDVAFRIVSRLLGADFWTPAGIRTVSRQSLDYSPYQNWGLRGGVWPGVTWWLAIAAGHFYPEVMVRALRASFDHFARDPRAHHTVPGQFAEWFDGESLVNQGMRLSPWEPPRFLWAALEGVCGLTPVPDRVHARPLLPAAWKWVALRRVRMHGRDLAVFVVRQNAAQLRFYSTGDLQVAAEHEVVRFEEDVSDQVTVLPPDAQCVALHRPGTVVIGVGSCSDQTITVRLWTDHVLEAGKQYAMAVYNSEHASWDFGAKQTAETLYDLSITIEANGCRLLALQEA
ncbi:MAG TPA: hypothetical protein VF916_00010, partial [Ktedonobacterales bacterium]